MLLSWVLKNSSACGYDVIMITMIKSRLRHVKLGTKIDFHEIVWKIVLLSMFMVRTDFKVKKLAIKTWKHKVLNEIENEIFQKLVRFCCSFSYN